MRGKSLFKDGPTGPSIDRIDLLDRHGGLLRRVYNKARSAVLYYFWNKAVSESDDRRATGQGLDQNKPEGLNGHTGSAPGVTPKQPQEPRVSGPFVRIAPNHYTNSAPRPESAVPALLKNLSNFYSEEITRFTEEPSAAEPPLDGSWLITLPAATVLLIC